MLECLKEIVGVSNSDCECITNGLDEAELAAIKKSTSGLYMDSLPGGVHLKALEDADACSNLARMAIDERDNAIRTLEDDLTVALSNEYKKSKPNFVGQIGRMSFAQTLAVNGRFQGMRLRPIDLSDAVVTLNKITLIVNAGAAFKIYIYKAFYGEDSGELFKTYDITSLPNMYVSVVTEPNADPKLAGLKLPLTEDGKALEYWVIYDRNEAGGAFPKDNGLECSTCGSQETKIARFINVHGVQFESLTNLKGAISDNYSHGLTLDLSIKCDKEQLFCREYNNEEAISTTMARAVYFKAGELLIEAVLKSPQVNRYTTMNREYLWGKRNAFRKEYDGRVEFLAAAIDVSASNCYVCREQSNQPFFAGIMS